MKKIMALMLALSVAIGMMTVASAETRYYLANRPLDVEEDTGEDESAEPEGSAGIDANANANPGTGC